MQPYGPWKILGSRQVYRDPWIEVRRDDVIRPDGAAGTHCVVRMKPGVCVLPLDEQQCVYLTDEFHYGIGRCGLEAVSGGIDPGEDPLQTARRELQEELGIEAEQWTSLGTVDPFTTIVVSPTALFLAEQLRFGSTAHEGTERIRTVKTSLDDAVGQVLDGRITHGPSGLLILKAHLWLQQHGRRR